MQIKRQQERTEGQFPERCWPFRLWRHIASELLFPLICCLAAFAILFLLNHIQDDLPDFDIHQIPFKVLAAYFLALLPEEMQYVIPMAMLVATSYMTVLLGKNNELTAMRSSGLALPVCAVPVWVIALILCFCSLAVSEHFATSCKDFCRTVRQEWTSDKKDKAIENSIVYASPTGQSDCFFTSLLPDGTCEGIVLRKYDGGGRTMWVVTAANGRYEESKWVFSDCTKTSYKYDSSALAILDSTEKLAAFYAELKETPRQILDSCKDVSALDLLAIRRLLDRGEIGGKQRRLLRTLAWHRLTFPLASLVGALFGFALTIANGRSGVMKGFALAVFFMMLFIGLGQFTLVLGKNDVLPPLLAGGGSNMLFVVGGMVAVWKKR